MATVAQQPQTPSAAQYPTATSVMGDSRSSSSSQQTASVGAPAPPAQPLSASQIAKKGKGKKSSDPVDASKQIAAKIAQLELDAAGERDQEAEIQRDVKKAQRELNDMLATIPQTQAKLELVKDRYAKLLAEMKRTQRDYTKAKKRDQSLQKEKDAGRAEITKVTAMRDKLEKLSRSLSDENKKLKEDVRILQVTETKMRQELHDRLEQMALEVAHVIQSQEYPEPAEVELEQDEAFRQKFKSFIDQYEMRELQFHSLLRTKELEIQYQMARFEQQRKAQEMESSKSSQLTRQVSTFSQTETELRGQLNIYVEKFKQVEDTLNNSNDLFLTFRREMEEMSKKTKRLEKENLSLTRKQEATNRNILEMAEERARTTKELEQLRARNKKLENLCRGMQAQGRGQVNVNDLEMDEDGTESEYDDEYEDEEGSIEGEYDDETEEEEIEVVNRPRTFGPPPPPAAPQTVPGGKVNGPAIRQANGQLNGVKH